MTVHQSISDPVAELGANAALPFNQARAVPKSVYTAQAFLAAELAYIFSREWLCAGRAVPGHLSHLERPNYDFARYLASKVS